MHRFATASKTSPQARARKADYNSREHRAERERRRRVHHPSIPCAHCGHPCGEWGPWLHLPHNATRTGYLPGMAHARCNKRDAAIRGNREQARQHPELRRRVRRVTPLSL